MRKSVHIEKLPGGYSVIHWQETAPGVFRRKRIWSPDHNAAQKLKAELRLKAEAKQLGIIDPTLTAQNALDSYIQSLTHSHREATIKIRQYALSSFVSSIGPLNNLTNFRIKQWKTELLAKYHINTVTLRLRELRVFCNWLKQEGLIKESPFDGIELPREKEVGRKLEIHELRSILEHSHGWLQLYLAFLITCGSRRTETKLTQLKHINFKNKTWKIPAENSKGKRERELPLNDYLLSLLQNYLSTQSLREDSFLFPQYNIKRQFDKVLKKAKIVGRVRLHDLRHSFVSHWTGDPRLVADMVGWKGLQMLRKYSHFNVENLRSESSRYGLGNKLGTMPLPLANSTNYDVMSQDCHSDVTKSLPPSEIKNTH